jgi:hypothetical protein
MSADLTSQEGEMNWTWYLLCLSAALATGKTNLTKVEKLWHTVFWIWCTASKEFKVMEQLLLCPWPALPNSRVLSCTMQPGVCYKFATQFLCYGVEKCSYRKRYQCLPVFLTFMISLFILINYSFFIPFHSCLCGISSII